MLSRSGLQFWFIQIILSSLVILSWGNGYNIKVSINGISDTTLILGHYFSKSMYPDDTAHIDSKGKAIFKGDDPLAQGMYVIYLPNGKYFDIMMGEIQNFTIKTDTANFIAFSTILNSPDNVTSDDRII
ncbi:hypothetical protein ES708_04624 [subsurface metagenome]